MFKRIQKPTMVEESISILNQELPLQIHFERRYNWRISLGQSAILLRVPSMYRKNIQEPISWASHWLENKYKSNPQLFKKYLVHTPWDGKEYDTIYGIFKLSLQFANRKTATGNLNGNALTIMYPSFWGKDQQKEVFPNLISRTFASTFYPRFKKRVHQLNDEKFGFKIGKVQLKYNKSNWGSCTPAGNLNFSTRLFLTPEEVTDYVIIHELAHLKVMNHSKTFWQTVAAAMPDFKEKIKWLRQHGSALYY